MRSSLADQTGPTVWMTHFAGRSPAVVAHGLPGRQSVGQRRRAQVAGGREDGRAARPVDRPVDASAPEERVVGRVDDRIHPLVGDVAADDLDDVVHAQPRLLESS